MTIQTTDNFITQRGSDLYKIESQNLMSTMQDADLLLVSREQTNYKVSWSEVKDDLGGGGGNSIYPNTNDITITPSVIGTGTEFDPYVLSTSVAAPLGGAAITAETITIDSQAPNTAVKWTVTSNADDRFNQPESITDANGDWSGRLQYLDEPFSSGDTVYDSLFQIGLVYFSWRVEQKEINSIPTVVTDVSLIDASPAEGSRFTSQSFVASSQVVDGFPVSTKTIDAHVDGTLSRQVKFDEPLESTSGNGVIYSGFFQDPVPQYVEQAFDGNYLDNSYNPGLNTIWRCPSGTLPGPYSTIKITTAGGNTVKVYSDEDNPPVTGTQPGVSLEFINLTGTFTNITGIDILLNGQNQTFIAEVVLDGVTLIDGSKALTFANGTDMEGLASGDTVNQIINFTEPLESKTTTVGPIYSSVLTGNWDDPTQMYDGKADTRSTGSLSGGAYYTVFEGEIPCKSLALKIGTDQTLGGTTRVQWTFADGTTDNVVVSGSVGIRSLFQNSSDQTLTKLEVSNSTPGEKVYIYYIEVNGSMLVDGETETSLTFANGTDMSALAPGDAVSGPSATAIYSDGLAGVASGSPSNAFDGNVNTYVSASGGGSKITWIPPSGSLGNQNDVVQVHIRIGSNNNIDYYYADGSSSTSNCGDSGGGCAQKTMPAPLIKLETTGTNSEAGNLAGIKLNGTFLVDGASVPVNGTVGSITDTAVELSETTGGWTIGGDVTTGNKTTSGTVASVADTTATLSSSSGSWINGGVVSGPQKTIVEDNARLYCAFDSDGNITDLQNNPQDPPYKTQDSNPGLTFTFPATFPSGQTPDEELPEGTTFTVEVTAENSAGTSGPLSATVQPEPEPEPIGPALAGLTTLYTGDGTDQSIINGIDLLNDGGLVWVKCRSAGYDNALNDSSSEFVDTLSSNSINEANSNSPLTVLSNGFVSRGTGVDGQTGQDYVAWTFNKAEGYFDVVKFTGTGVEQNISHSLGTKPGLIIVKRLETASTWFVYHASLGYEKGLMLNESNAVFTNATVWSAEPTSTKFTVGTNSTVNAPNEELIAYLFAEDTPGVIKCGSFIGNGSTQNIDTTFKPQWVLIKGNTSAAWAIWDLKRTKTGNYASLNPNSNSEEWGGDNNVDFLIDGFQVTISAPGDSFLNASGVEYVYVAIAAPPDTRSQTPAELAEAKLKFATFENRSMVKCGNDAEAARDALIQQLALDGYSLTEILNYL